MKSTLVFTYFLASIMSKSSAQRHESEHYPNGEHNSAFDHQAFLGSKEAADEFKVLSSSEAKKRLSLIIEKIDLNNDGFIVREELVEWLEIAFRNLSFNLGQKRIEKADKDQDRVVTWAEYYQLNWAKEDKRGLTSKERKLLLEERRLFLNSDIDGDELLSYEEIRALATPGEHQQMQRLTLRKAISSSDNNDNGRLDFSEYLENISVNGGYPNKKDPITEFKKRDLNKDNELDIDELAVVLFPSARAKAEKETEHLIEYVDSDEDGRLSYEEMLKNSKSLVGHMDLLFKDEL